MEERKKERKNKGKETERKKTEERRWMTGRMLNKIEQEKRDKICGDKLKNG